MADEDAVEAVVHILAKLCPEAAADAPDEIRYIASMLTDKVRNRLQAVCVLERRRLCVEARACCCKLTSAWTNLIIVICITFL